MSLSAPEEGDILVSEQDVPLNDSVLSLPELPSFSEDISGIDENSPSIPHRRQFYTSLYMIRHHASALKAARMNDSINLSQISSSPSHSKILITEPLGESYAENRSFTSEREINTDVPHDRTPVKSAVNVSVNSSSPIVKDHSIPVWTKSSGLNTSVQSLISPPVPFHRPILYPNMGEQELTERIKRESAILKSSIEQMSHRARATVARELVLQGFEKAGTLLSNSLRNVPSDTSTSESIITNLSNKSIDIPVQEHDKLSIANDANGFTPENNTVSSESIENLIPKESVELSGEQFSEWNPHVDWLRVRMRLKEVPGPQLSIVTPQTSKKIVEEVVDTILPPTDSPDTSSSSTDSASSSDLERIATSSVLSVTGDSPSPREKLSALMEDSGDVRSSPESMSEKSVHSRQRGRGRAASISSDGSCHTVSSRVRIAAQIFAEEKKKENQSRRLGHASLSDSESERFDSVEYMAFLRAQRAQRASSSREGSPSRHESVSSTSSVVGDSEHPRVSGGLSCSTVLEQDSELEPSPDDTDRGVLEPLDEPSIEVGYNQVELEVPSFSNISTVTPPSNQIDQEELNLCVSDDSEASSVHVEDLISVRSPIPPFVRSSNELSFDSLDSETAHMVLNDAMPLFSSSPVPPQVISAPLVTKITQTDMLSSSSSPASSISTPGDEKEVDDNTATSTVAGEGDDDLLISLLNDSAEEIRVRGFGSITVEDIHAHINSPDLLDMNTKVNSHPSIRSIDPSNHVSRSPSVGVEGLNSRRCSISVLNPTYTNEFCNLNEFQKDPSDFEDDLNVLQEDFSEYGVSSGVVERRRRPSRISCSFPVGSVVSSSSTVEPFKVAEQMLHAVGIDADTTRFYQSTHQRQVRQTQLSDEGMGCSTLIDDLARSYYSANEEERAELLVSVEAAVHALAKQKELLEWMHTPAISSHRSPSQHSKFDHLWEHGSPLDARLNVHHSKMGYDVKPPKPWKPAGVVPRKLK